MHAKILMNHEIGEAREMKSPELRFRRHTLFQQGEEQTRSAHDVHGVRLVVADTGMPGLEEMFIVSRAYDG